MRLSIKGMAIAGGIFWAIIVFLSTWLAILFLEQVNNPALIGRIWYIGYDISPLGSLIGLIYGFIDGFICGAFLSWLYNCFCSE